MFRLLAETSPFLSKVVYLLSTKAKIIASCITDFVQLESLHYSTMLKKVCFSSVAYGASQVTLEIHKINNTGYLKLVRSDVVYFKK